MGVVSITRSISHRYLHIKVTVSGLLPRDIHWSARRVKIKKTNAYLKDYCEKSNKMTFMPQDPDWILPDNSLNMELYYKDHLLLIEDGNRKFSKSIMETLQVVLSPQSSSQSSSSSQSLSATATPFNPECQIFLLDTPTGQPKFQVITCITTLSPSVLLTTQDNF